MADKEKFIYHTLSNDTVVKFPSDMSTKLRMEKIKQFEEAIGPGPVGASIKAASHGLETVAPDSLRYGVPIIAGTLSKNAWITSALDGVAEFGARELEDYLEKHPKVDQVAVVGASHETWGESIWAYIKLPYEQSPPKLFSDEHKKLEDDIKAYCSENLAGYKIPEHIIPKTYLPLNRITKGDKKSLKEEVEKIRNKANKKSRRLF